MPRHVDQDQRRRDVIEATLSVIAERGTRGLSFRAVAGKLGGSTTLVTHYFPNQQALLDAVSASALDRWSEEISELDSQSDDPRPRLRNLLVWLVPTTDAGLRDERARVNLVSGDILGESNRAMFESWDRTIRGFLAGHLQDLVPEDRVDSTVELLRVTTTGITLAVVERPDSWTPERQLAALDHLLEVLGLAPE